MYFKREKINGETVYVSENCIAVKRGVTFFLYRNYDDCLADDVNESANLARINAGKSVFNRCVSGLWITWNKRLNYLVENAKEALSW